jgi:uridine kinase
LNESLKILSQELSTIIDNTMADTHCLVIGITGPSGSGKSSLAKRLAQSLRAALFPEDPKFFLASASASYEHRDPVSETPSHVDWDAYVVSLRSKIQEENSMVVDHFLLLQDDRVVEELDVLLFLDPGSDDDARNRCRERRVNRNPHRPPEEERHLRRYYDNHVWPSYQVHGEGPTRIYCRNHSSKSKILDCRHAALDEVACQAIQFVNAWKQLNLV